MESRSLCILGACRNVEAYLPQVLENLNTIASWWKECKIVVYENDSTDQTPHILAEWKASGGHREVVQESNLEQRYPMRTDRLAYIRNRLLHYIPPTFDYVFMVDMDDVFTKPIQKSSFEACFTVECDVVTADTEGYYDIWALRIPGVLEFDCWQMVYTLMNRGITEQEAKQLAIHDYTTFMNSLTTPIIVHSAFNAGALFKVSAIRSCCRFLGSVDGREICEHVPFQNCIRSHGARILFHPEFKL